MLLDQLSHEIKADCTMNTLETELNSVNQHMQSFAEKIATYEDETLLGTYDCNIQYLRWTRLIMLCMGEESFWCLDSPSLPNHDSR